ncbi:uroporphyrinogen decarboxylase [candidate division KSB1 bacterium]
MNSLGNDLFLRASRRLPVERTPVWIMRQAGRYLPQYRKIKEKFDFLTLCKTPELAAEVTIQPVDILDVDAAIIFSDILVIPHAMGMDLQMESGAGPVFTDPIRTESDAAKLKQIDPAIELKYVMNAVSLTKNELNRRVPLIGFSGSPWTLLCYMVEGRGTKHFSIIKSLIYDSPDLAHSLLKKLALVTAEYLSAKIEAGADALQIFDTWGGLLSQHKYIEFSLDYIREVIANIRRKEEPVIVFSKGVHHSFEAIIDSGADVVGLDNTMDIGDVRRLIGGWAALQGNMDPCVLFATREHVREEVIRILESFGQGTGHIFNLGHGILPGTDPETAKAFVRYVKEESIRFHKSN